MALLNSILDALFMAFSMFWNILGVVVVASFTVRRTRRGLFGMSRAESGR